MSEDFPNVGAAPRTAPRQFPCKHCGAHLVFEPGEQSLKCPYCGTVNELPAARAAPVEEEDYQRAFAACCREEDLDERITVRCGACGAETTLAPNVTAGLCPFCGASIVAEAASKKLIRPKAVLPFVVTREQAGSAFRQWIASRWFAPGELKRRAEAAQITGVYLPCWTYDTRTQTDYTGERGDDYWDTETYISMENGRSVTRTRQVQKTRWWPASGTVEQAFDDVLVLATRSLPPKLADALEPWDLKSFVPYRDEYLSGFVAESYQIDLTQGFEIARGIMAGPIRQTIARDIGGDHQRIHSVDTHYFDVTFKHALLPVWISAYRYAGRTFRFMVNARTGEVQGERPYSWVKILLAILAAMTAILIALLVARSQQ
jgi:predicted RNA-binding Zn-ribbon protein involved in translation (DUF1610 family)